MDEEKARSWERYTTFMVNAEGRFPVCDMKRLIAFYDTLTPEEQVRFDDEVARRCEARLRMLYGRRSRRRPPIESDVGMADYDDARGDYDDDSENDEFLTDFEKSLRISRAVRQAELDAQRVRDEVEVPCCRPPLPLQPSPPPSPPRAASRGPLSLDGYPGLADQIGSAADRRQSPRKPKRKAKVRV
ncbi:pr29 [rat cytomegalovirus strain Maastricht]|uniref:Pr29 n=1 Tax=Rat cytomegalovirus (strain Maastricht) TaxID=79700 RepID=Q9DWF9_RCMVM|nr:pr29 [rat cytomegalovirus strain Maastricht]AAF99130.1 pr29 [rat cytomegalovirus strain Maastricht]WEG71954.1 protein m29.1 [Murid betaherpesvirus 2]